MFVGAGFNAFGIASGGGAGWVLAQWVVDGEAPLDLWVVDIRRFSGLHRDRQWVCDRTLEAYGKHYTIGFPHEEYLSGRPRIVSPLYERLKTASRRVRLETRLGAAELVRARGHASPEDIYSMGRQNWFSAVGDEHRHVREKVGIFDQSSFAKYEMTGADAQKALDWICANDVAKPVGRLTYTQLLNTRGGIEADLTVARLGEEKFYIVTGTGFRTHDFAWIGDHVGKDLDVTLERRHRGFRHAVADGAARARRAGGGDRRGRVERRLPVRPCARDRDRRPHGAGAARHLCRRARLGTACADRRNRRGLRRADGGGQAARHPPGRLPRAGIAQAGKGLSRLGLRHHAQRHAVGGRPRLGGEAEEEHRFRRPAGTGEDQRRRR